MTRDKAPRAPAWKVRDFLHHEAASGVLLVAATALAMLMANSAAAGLYEALLGTPVSVRVGAFAIDKPLLLWVNDGLMAVFFFLVGLEIKREVLEGALADRSRLTLPVLAALGGMAAPSALYLLLNRGDPVALRGWAIPAATDIAFALGVLALFGRRVPAALKLFLLALAILDDLGAIVIIAIFYTGELSVLSLAVAALALFGLGMLGWSRVTALPAYLFIGLVLWAAVLKSGIHATLAGVVLAFFIPLREPGGGRSPLRKLEEELHPSVAYGILPLFAFANAGVSLRGLDAAAIFDPVPLGIALGLFVGKQLGVFGLAAAAIRLRLARLPEGASWGSLYGASLLCGVGFTMSLFIGSLAFEEGGPASGGAARLGILAGSLISALAGYAVLRVTLPPRAAAAGA